MAQQTQVAVQAAASPPMTVSKMMSNDAIKARFNEVLGQKAKGFISSVISVSNLPTLRGTDPQSVIASAMVAATLDLPINPNLGYAYIVGYNDRKNGTNTAQFQMGYKGFVQLAIRSGQFEIINASDVREGEILDEDLLTGEIKCKTYPRNERSKHEVIGYIAYIKLVNGFHKTLFMSNDELKEHAKKYSQSYRNDKYGTSLWNTQFDSMAKKTVLKQLLSKYGLLSIEMQNAVQFDQASVRMNNDYSVEEAVPDYVDNVQFEEVETPPADIRSAAERIKAENEAKAKAMEQASESFATDGKQQS